MKSFTPQHTGDVKCAKCGMYYGGAVSYFTEEGGPICSDCYNNYLLNLKHLQGEEVDIAESFKKLEDFFKQLTKNTP